MPEPVFFLQDTLYYLTGAKTVKTEVANLSSYNV